MFFVVVMLCTFNLPSRNYPVTVHSVVFAGGKVSDRELVCVVTVIRCGGPVLARPSAVLGLPTGPRGR